MKKGKKPLKRFKKHYICPALLYWQEYGSKRTCGHDLVCCFLCPDRSKCRENGCATAIAYRSPKECRHFPILEDEARTILSFIETFHNKTGRRVIPTIYNEFERALTQFADEKRKKLGWREGL